MDDLRFLVAGESVLEIKKSLEKAGKIALNWAADHAVTYDIGKTEAVLFSKARNPKLKKQLSNIPLRLVDQTIFFNKEATRWLGMWFDSRLIFKSHVNEKLRKAKIAESRIKGLSKTYVLSPALVQRVQIAAVQSVALYGAEIWWKNQKNHQNEIQKLINQQACLITGMYPSTPIGALISESGLTPAHVMLDFRQRKYAHRILSLPDSIPTKEILPITLRIGDGNAQVNEQPEKVAIWASNERITNYGKRLARQISIKGCVDPAEGTEPILASSRSAFPRKLIIEGREKAIRERTIGGPDLELWCDGSKLDKGGTGAAVVWKSDCDGEEWQTVKVSLGQKEEIFDAEMWGISKAIKVAEQKSREVLHSLVISIFCDSQTTINNLREDRSSGGQGIKRQIYQKTERLVQQGHDISIRWIPGHSKIEGNERADRAAKEAAGEGKVQTARWTSLAHIKRQITEEKKLQIYTWYQQKPRNERVISEVSIFLVLKHRFTPSWARLKSFTHHVFIN